MENTFALNVLQKLDHCFTAKNNLFSVVLQGDADSASRFILIDVGAYIKQSDGGTFCGSILYHFLEDFEFTLAKLVSSEGSAKEMPFFILGNESCHLKIPLTKPLTRNNVM